MATLKPCKLSLNSITDKIYELLDRFAVIEEVGEERSKSGYWLTAYNLLGE